VAQQRCAREGCSRPVPDDPHGGAPRKYCSRRCRDLARNARRRARDADGKAARRKRSNEAFARLQHERAEAKAAAAELEEIRKDLMQQGPDGAFYGIMGDVDNGRPRSDGLVPGRDRLRPQPVEDIVSDADWNEGELSDDYELEDYLEATIGIVRSPAGQELAVQPYWPLLRSILRSQERESSASREPLIVHLLSESGNPYLAAVTATSADAVEELGGENRLLGCWRAVYRAARTPRPQTPTALERALRDRKDARRIRESAERRKVPQPRDPLVCRDLADAVAALVRRDPESIKRLADDIEQRRAKRGLEPNSTGARLLGRANWTPGRRAA